MLKLDSSAQPSHTLFGRYAISEMPNLKASLISDAHICNQKLAQLHALKVEVKGNTLESSTFTFKKQKNIIYLNEQSSFDTVFYMYKEKYEEQLFLLKNY